MIDPATTALGFEIGLGIDAEIVQRGEGSVPEKTVPHTPIIPICGFDFTDDRTQLRNLRFTAVAATISVVFAGNHSCICGNHS